MLGSASVVAERTRCLEKSTPQADDADDDGDAGDEDEDDDGRGRFGNTVAIWGVVMNHCHFPGPLDFAEVRSARQSRC